MAEIFRGRWRLRVSLKNAEYRQRILIEGASSGNGAYDGVVGTEFVVDGDSWMVRLQWNNDAGSGWRDSAVFRAVGSVSPLVLVHILRADDNFESKRDNDYDDLVVFCEDQDPVFDVVQRPFAMDRGTLTMMPDGIFDASQAIHYMGVRIRNDWDYDWDDWTDVMIGISNTSRASLASQGIQVIDSWSSAEQQALQQEVSNGFVKIPSLKMGDERTVYFKIDVRNAPASKPEVAFVAQRLAWDPAYDEPWRQVDRQIFISRSTYDHANREMVAQLPEGTVYVRLNRVLVDKESLRQSLLYALRHPCEKTPPRPGRPGAGGAAGGGYSEEDLREDLKDFLEDILAGKRIDPCRLRELLELCCRRGRGDGLGPGGDHGDGWTGPGDGGLADGPGGDDWCRFRPFNWLPVDFEYRIVPDPAYSGQFGPLAFEDPWWKALLIFLAIILAIASLVYDYTHAAQDPEFVIGNIHDKSNRRSGSNVDAAIALLNGSRGIDLNVLDAQSDDRNNNLPIDGGVGGTASMNRSDNADRGIEDPQVGNVVFKSGARGGTTRGVVDDVTFDQDVDQNDGTTVHYTDQVLIVPLPSPNDQPLSQGGDSGSVWVDLISRRPVALNFAGPTDDSGDHALANPIRDVVQLLNIHFNT